MDQQSTIHAKRKDHGVVKLKAWIVIVLALFPVHPFGQVSSINWAALFN
jgi:hypothetical protein